MKIVIAIDSFKGCLTSQEANEAAASGVESCHPDAQVMQIPVSDGGEGFVEAFKPLGGEIITMRARDPLMRPITVQYLLNDRTAVIEVAQACGLALLTVEERNPIVATTYGVGQMVADAVRRGARHIIVGVGGTATVDMGIGMLRALVDAFADGGAWDDIKLLKPVRFTLATDVSNPLTGASGAAHMFGPQKGATPDMVNRLEERALKFAEVSARHFGYDRSSVAGAGAAGGLGYAFMQYLNAECRSGIDLLLESIGFERLVQGADMVLTGEGAADAQTLLGKLPLGILRQSNGVPVCLIAGRVSDREQLLQAGFTKVECINPPELAHQEAMNPDVARHNIAHTVSALLKDW